MDGLGKVSAINAFLFEAAEMELNLRTRVKFFVNFHILLRGLTTELFEISKFDVCSSTLKFRWKNLRREVNFQKFPRILNGDPTGN